MKFSNKGNVATKKERRKYLLIPFYAIHIRELLIYVDSCYMSDDFYDSTLISMFAIIIVSF